MRLRRSWGKKKKLMTKRRKIIPYNPKLTEFTKSLRNNSTKSEIKLWRVIKGKEFRGYDFHRQKPLLNFIADFYCHELDLVIELDGLTHESEETKRKDIFKQSELEKEGLTVLRFTDDEIFSEFDKVMSEIEEYIDLFEKKQ
jgi:very-short-patch-repair endonuclease